LGETKLEYACNVVLGTQFIRTVNLPGFIERIFEVWFTWEQIVNETGRRVYVIAFAPLEKYQGETHSCVDGTEHVVRGVSSGVHRIKELTDNTCEWTRVQRVDLKVKGMPKAVAQVITKNQLGFANEIQELYRRNGKEVDREKMDALTQIMRERRGENL